MSAPKHTPQVIVEFPTRAFGTEGEAREFGERVAASVRDFYRSARTEVRVWSEGRS